MRSPIPPLPLAWPPAYPRHRAVPAATARALDGAATGRHGVPSLVLMEHAAAGLAALAALLAPPPARILVLCGPGNNGGDGYGAARFLASWGLEPRVLSLAPRLPASPDASFEAARAAEDLSLESAWDAPHRVQQALAGADLVVDAIFGIGSARLEGAYPGWIAAINAADALRLAVDLPSGLHADLGTPQGIAVRADVTATMGLPKTGLVPPSPGVAWVGQLVEVDIGLPAALHLPYRRDPLSG